jgi:small subunit ribosomal protein S20
MPHTPSAKKNLRKSIKRRAKNRNVKRDIKEGLKGFQVALGTTQDAAKTDLLKAIRTLDQAAARKTIHPNTAARKKSQIARAFNAKFAQKA